MLNQEVLLNQVEKVEAVTNKIRITSDGKVDQRSMNPGRPKSLTSLKHELFLEDLYENRTKFTIDGVVGVFNIGSGDLYKNDVWVGSIDKIFPTKFRVITKSLIGNSIEEIIKLDSIEMC
jgi:hypothetical protein